MKLSFQFSYPYFQLLNVKVWLQGRIFITKMLARIIEVHWLIMTRMKPFLSFTLFSMLLKASIIKRHLKSLFVIGEISCLKGQKHTRNMRKWSHHKPWAKKSPSLFHGWSNKMQDLKVTISKVPCWHHGCFCIFQQITTATNKTMILRPCK